LPAAGSAKVQDEMENLELMQNFETYEMDVDEPLNSN
jgi:hypothetical protein